MRFIQKVLASLPFKTMTFSGTLYHGSPTLVDDFDVAKGSGRYGKGLYLTPDLEIAKFYAEGGRQGAAGQRLKRGSGYIYEFKLSGKTLKVLDEGETLREMVGDLEKAEDAFSAVGDLFSKSVTKYLAEWANEDHNADIIWIASKDMGVHSPLEQVVVTNQAVIKSWKLYKRVSQASKSVGKLYIFISPEKLALAMKSGVMKPLSGSQPMTIKKKDLHYKNDRGDSIFYGVSTTRNPNWKPNETHKQGYWDKIRLTLDGDKISTKYPIKSYNDFWKSEKYSQLKRSSKDDFYAQSEEKIITDKDGFKGWFKYLLAVDVLDTVEDEVKDLDFKDVPVTVVKDFSKRKVKASPIFTSEEVVRHLDNTSPREDLDNQYYDIGEYEEWELKNIPINKLDFTLANVSNKESENLLNAYIPLKTKAPPIIIVPSEILGGKYRIVDGYHRVGAAKKRGEKEVMAYIPVGAA